MCDFNKRLLHDWVVLHFPEACSWRSVVHRMKLMVLKHNQRSPTVSAFNRSEKGWKWTHSLESNGRKEQLGSLWSSSKPVKLSR